DTNYMGKAKKALKFLEENDFVFIHVESIDEMGHEGNVEGKIKALEDFDNMVVGTILDNIGKLGEFRVLVLGDHPTPVSLKTFGETNAGESGIMISPGHRLMNHFIVDWKKFIEEKRN
ncbi:MAG: phosphoglycerate mutase, partial [Desulfobacteraceae bacterium 4484_190.3]